MDFEAAGRLLGACVVIGIVLFVFRAVARALGRTSALAAPGGRIVAVLETTVLPGATSLHVVRVAERYYLIGRGASMAMLCEIPPESVGTSAAVERAARSGGMLERWVRLRRSLRRG